MFREDPGKIRAVAGRLEEGKEGEVCVAALIQANLKCSVNEEALTRFRSQPVFAHKMGSF